MRMHAHGLLWTQDEVITWTSMEEIILLSVNNFHLRAAPGEIPVTMAQLRHINALDLW